MSDTVNILGEKFLLETNIAMAVSKLVEEFKERVGIPVTKVDITIANVATIGEHLPDYVVSGAVIDLDLNRVHWE